MLREHLQQELEILLFAKKITNLHLQRNKLKQSKPPYGDNVCLLFLGKETKDLKNIFMNECLVSTSINSTLCVTSAGKVSHKMIV